MFQGAPSLTPDDMSQYFLTLNVPGPKPLNAGGFHATERCTKTETLVDIPTPISPYVGIVEQNVVYKSCSKFYALSNHYKIVHIFRNLQIV